MSLQSAGIGAWNRRGRGSCGPTLDAPEPDEDEARRANPSPPVRAQQRRPFPAIALGARSQVPRDYGMRTPPPRRQGQDRRLPPQPSLESAGAATGAPARRPEVQDIRQPAEWVLRDPPAHLRRVRAPNPHLGVPGARNCELLDALRHFAYPLPRGRGGPAMYALWRRFLLQYARLCNNQYAAPLSDADVEKTARSVSRFTWLNPSFGRPARGGGTPRSSGGAPGWGRWPGSGRCWSGTGGSPGCTGMGGATGQSPGTSGSARPRWAGSCGLPRCALGYFMTSSPPRGCRLVLALR